MKKAGVLPWGDTVPSLSVFLLQVRTALTTRGLRAQEEEDRAEAEAVRRERRPQAPESGTTRPRWPPGRRASRAPAASPPPPASVTSAPT